MGANPPVGGVPGQLWFDEDEERLYVFRPSGTWKALGASAPAVMPLISRNAANGGLAVAYASNEDFTAASNLADTNYQNHWRSVTVPSVGVPQGPIYDLSAVPAASRANVIVNWANQQADALPGNSGAPVPTLMPVNYTIQANAGAGGGAVPGSSWVTLATVTSNPNHGRAHLVNLTGYNWIRMYVTVSAGPGGNDDMELKVFDVHDAHLGGDDGILILGDSITGEGIAPFNALLNTVWTNGNLGQLVNAALPTRFPAVQGAGQSTQNIAYVVANFTALLGSFPCKYVGILIGANDANQPGALSAPTVATWYSNYLALIDAIIALGKVPVCAKLLWGNAQAAYAANAATLNGKIAEAMVARPTCIAGPDCYAYFSSHTNLLRDGLHPTYDTGVPAGMVGGLVGYEHLLRLWSEALVANVYS
jgi:lysophospholipase L1-like esterase